MFEKKKVFVVTATYEVASSMLGSEILGVTDSSLRAFKYIENFDGEKFMSEELEVLQSSINETVLKEIVTNDPKRKYSETHYYRVEDDSSFANGEGGTIIFSIDVCDFDRFIF